VVKPGANELVVRVGNTALNAMAGRPLLDYRLLNLRYGERFQAQTMDQVKPLPSGLLGPVRVEITPSRGGGVIRPASPPTAIPACRSSSRARTTATPRAAGRRSRARRS